MATWVKGILQVAFFVVYSWSVNALTTLSGLNIPGSIVGILLLFALLQTKIIKLEWIDLGAKWLIAEMLLFFIPSAVGVVQYEDLMRDNGVKLLLVVAVSILVVMAATGLMAERLSGRKKAASR
ncbi:CidA/LrgA family holin-like protein [Cohnella candidum]|uniref:CidA/LrgA family holin-like protein n=1 Tax=Cohnella candidum TaxID=2674991 RepID=A0A3G3K3D6_9BACL|nr:CidA/LrgA family holin-like protein [Cohnella candidum]AYQ74993.1 CidA/LrgA family holin-like protein [Cohnella candidum]